MNIQNTGTKNTMRMTFVAFAALSATMLAGVTQAAGFGDDPPKQTVSYQDLNLKSDAGIKVLYRRIQNAADQVCGNTDTRDLQVTSAKRACIERAISNAVAAVNSPMLTQVYLAKSGSRPRSIPVAQVR